MAKTNGATTNGLDAAKAQIIADAALRGASEATIAALALSMNYQPGATKAQAATAVPVTPEWAEQAKAALNVAPKPAQAAKGAERAERTTREWEGPFDNGVSKAGYPQVMIRTRTSTGAPFNLSLPLDAYMAISGGKLVKPSIG